MLTSPMAHLSLYRKYRPQTFAEIVGQEHVTQTLQKAVLEDRVAHAFLFSGPRGTGKTTSARVLAKMLNCEKRVPGKSTEPCNDCTSCREITEGTSLDVVEIDAASHGSVDDAREIREKVAYASVGGRWKVYIIDECHMLSPAANNALLKVLEEPPGHVVFVFATTEPHKVLQTLLDRCQRYEFRAVGPADAALRLRQVAEAEKVAIDDEVIDLIAGRSQGSVRDALSMLDQVISFSGDKVTFDDVTTILGSLPEEVLFEAIDLVAERDAAAVFMFADRLIRSGTDAREFMRSLVSHLRSLFLVMHVPATHEVLDVTDDQLERLRAQANRLDAPELTRIIDLANDTQIRLREGVEPRLALEIGLARMARPELHATPQSMLSRISRLERLAGIEDGDGSFPQSAPAPKEPKVAPKATPKVAEPASKPSAKAAEEPAAKPPARAEAALQPPKMEVPSGSVDIDKVKRAWPLLLEKVKKRKISFSALLLPAQPVAYTDGELVLEFGATSRFHKDKVSQSSQNGPLVEAFEELFGVRPRIACVLGGAEPPRKSQAAIQEEEPDDAGPVDDKDRPKDAIDVIRDTFSGAEVVED